MAVRRTVYDVLSYITFLVEFYRYAIYAMLCYAIPCAMALVLIEIILTVILLSRDLSH